MQEKVCKTCGVSKPVTEFPVERNGKLGVRTECRSCYNKSKSGDQQNLKEYALNQQGNKCVRCGMICDYLSTFPCQFAFHHVNPRLKKFNISRKYALTPEVIAELKKCKVLCHNCHSLVHMILDK